MNDLDAFLKIDAPNPKRRVSLSSSMARSQIQNLEGLIMGALYGGMDKMKLEGQFRAGGDDRTEIIIQHEHSAEVVSRFDGYF
jgi:hypothetical protein